MGMQQLENLLRRYRGQAVNIKTCSGGIYEGRVADITNDYVALEVGQNDEAREQVIVLLHSIEALLPRNGS